MALTLTAVEIWQLALIKLFFYLFIIFGIVLFFKIRKPILFVVLIALNLALTYFVLIQQSQLAWWGLQGDEIFVTAFLQKVASGQFFSDFFYRSLPPFYPPLYFWLMGGLAFLLKLNGIQAAKLGVLLVLFLTPFLVYFWQKLYWRRFKEETVEEWKLVLAPALVFIVADWSAVILKPYEFISAILAVFLAAFLFQDLYFKTFNYKKIIFYGISGGLLFLIFYFWFFPLILAAALFKLFSSEKIKYYFVNLIAVLAVLVLISLPFTLPLLASYWRYGAENWQPAFFVPQDLNLYLPFFQFSVFGLISLVGLLTILCYWQRPYIKALGALFISAYLWQFISLLTIIFFQAPFEPAKSFLFLGGAILSIAAAYGIGEFVSEKVKKNLFAPIFVLGWVILSSQLLGGSHLDDFSVQQQLIIAKRPPRQEFIELIDELKQVAGINELTILSSGIPQISAYLPLNYYISYNIHYSHPAANFSQRYYFIQTLASSLNAEDFYQKIKDSPFDPIDALLFYKGEQNYPVFFWLDDYPLGGREDVIEIPVNLINDQYFAKVFEDKYFVFYRIK